VIHLLGKYADDDAFIVTDVGQHQMVTVQHFPYHFPRQQITSGGLGTMGFGVPAALGVQFAHPSRQVVVVVGDGGFQMTNQELALVNIHHLPIKIILLNNGVLGMVRQSQAVLLDKRYSGTTLGHGVDFQKLAESYGIEHIQIQKDSELEEKLAKALASDEAQLIEIFVDENALVLPMVPSGKRNDEMIGVLGEVE